jgi:hypothetical protein
VAARAAAAATAAGGGSKKAVYLGEFGVSLPDRHNASSPIYAFTQEMLAAAQSSGAALATLWTWCAKIALLSQLFLCLSRACLGKMIVFIHKLLKKGRFSQGGRQSSAVVRDLPTECDQSE